MSSDLDRPSRILLVDDEPGLREAVQAYLEDSGFEVVAAVNGQQAFQLLSTAQPDLVISDIMMPGMDGYQFLAQLRQLDAYSHLPVVFLTAKGMTADRIQGYRAGADVYLPKPFDPEELVAIVENLLERAKSSAPSAALARELDAIRDMIAEVASRTEPHSPHPAPASESLMTAPMPIPQRPPLQVNLTPREQEVLEKVSEGLMNKEIAKQLQTSVRNVEKYVTRLLNKTGTSSRTELVRFALTYGLISL
ncbi:MAG: response regulator transcription factor [Synechococcaceae cyanobacterium SM2_3_2]|nr:response regulator transcription factor [Synechococcaceae cyanobacterium SM2_3_2]